MEGQNQTYLASGVGSLTRSILIVRNICIPLQILFQVKAFQNLPGPFQEADSGSYLVVAACRLVDIDVYVPSTRLLESHC